MRIKKILFILLVLIVVGLIVSATVLHIRHMHIASICDLIETGQTEKAIEKISHTLNVNEYSAPRWVRPLYLIVDYDLRLPLVEACKAGNLEIVKILLDKGADPNKFLEGNWSPLEAVFIGKSDKRLELAEILVENGADVNLFAGRHSAMFEEASILKSSQHTNSKWDKKKSLDCIFFLLDNNAQPIDSESNTIVHYMSCTSHIDALEDILQRYPELLSYQNDEGMTPLMWAASNGCIEGVECLIENGASIDVVDYSNKTALDYAIENGNEEIIQLLS